MPSGRTNVSLAVRAPAPRKRASHVGADPGQVAVVERQQGGDHRRQGALVVHEPEAVPHRRIPLAGSEHLPAARCLEELVVARPVGPWAGRAVGARVAEHDVGVDGPNRLRVDAEPTGGGHPDVVVHDVGPADGGFDGGPGARCLQIEGDAELAPLAAVERPAGRPHGVTGGRLDLDDGGSEVGEQHQRVRAGQVSAEIEHLDALEGVPGVGARVSGRARRPPGQDLVSVGAVGRRRAAHRLRGRDGEGLATDRDAAVLGIVDLDDVAVGPGLLVVEDVAERQARLHGHVVGPELLEPCLTVGGEERLDQGVRTVAHGRDDALDHRGLHRVAHHVDPLAVGALVDRRLRAAAFLREADPHALRGVVGP